jgi:hypothetical protein
VDDLQGRRDVAEDNSVSDGAWAAFVAHVRDSERGTAVISDERLSLSGPAAIALVGRSFVGCELRVVVTVRDLGRVVMSSWEEAVRGGAVWTWDEYVRAIGSARRRGTNPARGFWARQDLARITAAWEAIVPNDAITVVTVPPPGAPSDLLLHRFCDAVGVSPAGLVNPPRRANTALGPAGTELVRRLNGRLTTELNRRQYDHVIKQVIAPRLAQRSEGAPLVGAVHAEWLQPLAEEEIAELATRGYRVIGDVEDLRPVVGEGQEPVDVADAEVLDAALDALAALAARHARLWWSRRDQRPDRAAGGSTAGSRARRLAFRARGALLGASDKNKVLGKAAAVAYRVRGARQEHAMRAARRRRKS